MTRSVRICAAVLVLVVSAVVGVPIMSGAAPFEGDYEDQIVGKMMMPQSGGEELSELPPPSAKIPANIQRQFALMMQKDQVPGAPPVQRDPSLIKEISELDERARMRPSEDEPFDEDCDSFQSGEIEPFLPNGADITMTNASPSNVSVPEQANSEREVLMDSDNFAPVQKELVVPVADAVADAHSLEVNNLPAPDPEVAKFNKCSKNTNGHDVPDPLADLGEDCGMPEPIIPCETAGNSSRCDPLFVLRVPPLPTAEKMPALPAAELPSGFATMSVEFPDFGISHTVKADIREDILAVVLRAGKEFELEAWHIQMIRNGGFEISQDRQVFQLPDDKTTIVYLRCTKKAFVNALIVRLVACEDIYTKQLLARVEVPETDDLYEVDILSSQTVQDVIEHSPIPIGSIDKITYNGARVMYDQTLNEIRFANRSALVVYLKPQPQATGSGLAGPTSGFAPSLETPTPAPRPSNETSTGSGSAPPPAVPIPKTDDPEPPRQPMTEPAVVTVHIQDSEFLDFPMFVTPEHIGLVIYEALHDRTGRPLTAFNVVFQSIRIDQATELKPIGLRDGDVLNVMIMPAQ